MKTRLTCNQPDADVPKLKCGAPLPCRHHTAIIEQATGAVTVPREMTHRQARKVRNVARKLT